MEKYILKFKRDDFIVTENIDLKLEDGDYFYYSLKKSGLSTIQCIKQISEYYEIPLLDIGYAGLKDEEGITDQTISIFKRNINDMNIICDSDNWFKLIYIGTGKKPIRIGRLLGNNFDITIRNVPKFLCEQIVNYINEFQLINYYDMQRFGLPGQERLAHKVGEALLLRDFDRALLLLYRGGNILKDEYLSAKDNSFDFWTQMDYRFYNFFLNANDSFCWNNKIVTMLTDLMPESIIYNSDGFRFVFPVLNCHLNCDKSSNILRHRYNGNSINEYISNRDVLVKTLITPYQYSKDPYFNEYNVSLKFSLPSGSYATMLARQLIHFFSMENCQ